MRWNTKSWRWINWGAVVAMALLLSMGCGDEDDSESNASGTEDNVGVNDGTDNDDDNLGGSGPGITDNDDDNLGESGPGIAECLWDEEFVAWGDEAPDGTVPDEVIAVAEGVYELTGGTTYHDGEEGYTVEFERRGEHAVYMTEKEGGCGERLELPGTLQLMNEGEQLNEEFAVEARLGAGEAVEVRHRFGPDDLEGSWEPVPPEDTDLRGLSVEVTFTEEDVTGRVLVLWETSDGGIASAGEEEVFFW